MAKTATTRKSNTVSKHSRAARRATSPSINTDKSLKSVQLPPQNKTLGIHHGAGVSKPKPKGKRLSRAQRTRQEKGVARAEAVMDQLEQKVARSVKKERAIKGRSNAWEDINHSVVDASRSRRKPNKSDDSDSEDIAENAGMSEEEALVTGKPDDGLPMKIGEHAPDEQKPTELEVEVS